MAFALFGKGLLPKNVNVSQIKMESKAFAKLMKEAGVMEGKLNLTRVDLCFTKCCSKASSYCTTKICVPHVMSSDSTHVTNVIFAASLPRLFCVAFMNVYCMQATKRMDFEEFKAALKACAEARGVDFAMMRDVVANCQPELRGTVAAAVKLHDDVGLYTGVHAKVRHMASLHECCQAAVSRCLDPF